MLEVMGVSLSLRRLEQGDKNTQKNKDSSIQVILRFELEAQLFTLVSDFLVFRYGMWQANIGANCPIETLYCCNETPIIY